MNLLTKTVPLFLVLFTALASGCNNLQLTECNKSEGCTWCAFSNKEGKQSGHCLINLIADKLPSGVCGGVLEEDDDDGDVLLRKEDDDGDELEEDDDGDVLLRKEDDDDGYVSVRKEDDDDDERLVRKEDDDDGDVLLRKEDDDDDELLVRKEDDDADVDVLLRKEDDDDELTYPGPKHNHPGPRDNPLPPFYKCILLDSVACDKSDICSICVVEDPKFKCCVPKMFFEFEMFSDICENGELTSSPSGLADELDGCAVHESENLCAQSKGTADDSCVWCGSDVDGACVEASYVADVGLCNLVSEK